jgi:hypothetical protein
MCGRETEMSELEHIRNGVEGDARGRSLELIPAILSFDLEFFSMRRRSMAE